MVFIQIPTQLTEEELMLQRKYQKLKRKKKALQQLKAAKPEPQPIQVTLKRTSESGKDPKEVAKKLLKSGKIKEIKAPDTRERQYSGFKRSKALERKRGVGSDKPLQYQPFSTVHDDAISGPSSAPIMGIDTTEISSTRVKPLYESFVSSRDPESIAREETFKEKKRDGKANYVNRDTPQQGNTIYVSGHGINEQLLRNCFSIYGNILNITSEMDKNCGFVTFDSINSANRAIDERDKKMYNNINLKVTLARRQPMIVDRSNSLPANISNCGQTSTSSAWTTIAASFSQKGAAKDKRDLVTYEENDIFG